VKIKNNELIFEKLVESNPQRREGDLNIGQAITIPQETEATDHSNAAGAFSEDLGRLFHKMEALSLSAAAICPQT